jgi:hypothetical protein
MPKGNIDGRGAKPQNFIEKYSRENYRRNYDESFSYFVL